MAGLPSSGYKASRASEHDLYTAMAIIACVFLLGAVVFVFIRSYDLFGTPFPGFTG